MTNDNNDTQENFSITKIFSVLDKKSNLWSRPMFVQSTGAMMRSFKDMANNKQEPIGQHPEDYYLYQIGTWNEFKGEIFKLKQNNIIGSALDYVDQPTPMQPPPLSKMDRPTA